MSLGVPFRAQNARLGRTCLVSSLEHPEPAYGFKILQNDAVSRFGYGTGKQLGKTSKPAVCR
ncbi:predicted protein [Plenodomus lingam JN3]|uniref:Predicted protein n=1 Tax=Leptosphaeria maculans (strain JN3 / isolate v23.1.3 / race Av1-4-5-6-7-8) TaxID=985895 RepID=E4ZIE9_LEPMJ|nr:predicted protein [Plenodomus lingam JN3]CBX90970.1 predicted protein [Plenodomus lingam JN3]